MATRLSRRKISTYYAKSLIDGANSKDLALKLASFLIDTGRVKELGSIVSDIEYQLSLSGIVSANVVSAHKLDEKTKQAIKDLITDKTKAHDVQLQETINEDVLGGVKIKFVGSELDSTIARRINDFRTNHKK